MNKTLLAAAVFSAVSLTACMGPMQTQHIEEIKPNETAFLIQLEGDSLNGQKALVSEDFLNQHKVAAKRVIIPQRKYETGRMAGSYKWIDTATLIKVDRTPVTREWTAGANGTSQNDESIHVHSNEPIGFSVGVTLTCSIPEAEAAKFLYNYAGTPLSEVADHNIRSFIQAELSNEFGQRDLEHGRSEMTVISNKVYKDAKAFFATKGISIDTLGFADKIHYDDPQIQQSINSTFKAQMDVITAEQNRLAQEKRNQQLVETSEAEKKAAEQFAAAGKAAIERRNLDIQQTEAQAKLTAAQRWNGQAPSGVVPSNSPFLFNFTGSK